MLRALVKNNAGLLLVVASEIFFAFMNLSVKVLTTEGDSGVSVLEVFFSGLALPDPYQSFLDYIAQDGEV